MIPELIGPSAQAPSCPPQGPGTGGGVLQSARVAVSFSPIFSFFQVAAAKYWPPAYREARYGRSRWRGGRFACYAPHVMPRGRAFNSDFRFSPDSSKSSKINRLQTEKDSIPIAIRSGSATSPHPPQPPAATFKSLYRKRANTPCSCPLLACTRFVSVRRTHLFFHRQA